MVENFGLIENLMIAINPQEVAPDFATALQGPLPLWPIKALSRLLRGGVVAD